MTKAYRSRGDGRVGSMCIFCTKWCSERPGFIPAAGPFQADPRASSLRVIPRRALNRKAARRIAPERPIVRYHLFRTFGDLQIPVNTEMLNQCIQSTCQLFKAKCSCIIGDWHFLDSVMVDRHQGPAMSTSRIQNRTVVLISGCLSFQREERPSSEAGASRAW